jgi:nucleoid-associated protein Lsr2
VQSITVVLTDDIDGSEATETVRFALDGDWYEIDLNSANAEKMREVIGEWADRARKSGAGSARQAAGEPERRRRRATTDPRSTAIRGWAKDNGHEIGGHGRIPAHVRELYEAEHG